MYTRRISFNEKMYLAIDQLDPGLCIQIVLEGEGELDYDDLKSAVLAATAVNPGARLIATGALGWMTWSASGPQPAVRCINDWGKGDAPLDLERSLSPKDGPTCEVIYAPGAITRVVFRCFHGVMDARGLLHFAEDVFRSLRGEALVGSDYALMDAELVESLVGYRTRAPLKAKWRPVCGVKSRRRGVIIARQMSCLGPCPGLVARIASALSSYATQHQNLPIRAMIPVDLRNYRRDLHATGNLTYPLFLDVETHQDWRRIHRKMLKQLGAKAPLSLDPSERFARWMPLWALKLFYRGWTARHRRLGLYPLSALISHVSLDTLAPLEGGGFTRRTAYFLPHRGDELPLVISAVSDQENAHIQLSGPDSLLSGEALDELCVAITREIDN